MHRRIVPESFSPPEVVEGDGFTLQILSPALLARDYEAYSSSVEHLRRTFLPGKTWPLGVTIEDALIDVCWCLQEYRSASSFSYGVLSHDRSYEIGSFYIWPSPKVGYDVQVRCWVRESELANGMDEKLYRWGHDWMANHWPFSSFAAPGRSISFADWDALEDKPL